MKIVLLNDDYPPQGRGGGATIVHALAKGYRNAGHDVYVITTDQLSDTDMTETVDGIHVHRLAIRYRRSLRAYLSLWNPHASRKIHAAFHAIGPVDAVHIHNIHGYLTYGSIDIAKQHAKKTVMTFHDVMSFSYERLATKKYLSSMNAHVSMLDQMKQAGILWNPLRNVRIRKHLRCVDATIAVSTALSDALHANGIHCDDVIHNGIDAKEVASLAQQGRVVQTGNDRYIFFGGRLSADKGIYQLCDAVLSMPDIPGIKIWIVGDEKKAHALINAYPRKGEIAPHVTMTGWLNRADLLAVMQTSTVCVTPSICFDSFPTVNLEAMALGIPVIATHFGGSKEIVQDEKTGYIIDPRDTAQFADRLHRLLSDANLRQTMSSASQQRIASECSLQKQIERYLAAMQS